MEFACWGHTKGVKFRCRGHPNKVKFQYKFMKITFPVSFLSQRCSFKTFLLYALQTVIIILKMVPPILYGWALQDRFLVTLTHTKTNLKSMSGYMVHLVYQWLLVICWRNIVWLMGSGLRRILLVWQISGLPVAWQTFVTLLVSQSG